MSAPDAYVDWLSDLTHKLRRGCLTLAAVENAIASDEPEDFGLTVGKTFTARGVSPEQVRKNITDLFKGETKMSIDTEADFKPSRPACPSLAELREMTNDQLKKVRTQLVDEFADIQLQLKLSPPSEDSPPSAHWRHTAKRALAVRNRALANIKAIMAERCAPASPGKAPTATFAEGGAAVKSTLRLLGLCQKLYDAVGVYRDLNDDESWGEVEAAHDAVALCNEPLSPVPHANVCVWRDQ